MLNLFIRGVLFAITDIVGNRTREQACLLRNETDLSAELLLSELADINTADTDSAAAYVIKSRNEINQRRFARAGTADDRCDFAALCREGNTR